MSALGAKHQALKSPFWPQGARTPVEAPQKAPGGTPPLGGPYTSPLGSPPGRADLVSTPISGIFSKPCRIPTSHKAELLQNPKKYKNTEQHTDEDRWARRASKQNLNQAQNRKPNICPKNSGKIFKTFGIVIKVISALIWRTNEDHTQATKKSYTGRAQKTRPASQRRRTL